MSERPARVLVAVGSPETLARVWAALADDPSLIVVASVNSGAEAASAVFDSDIQTIVCDTRILGDPAMDAMFSPHPWKPPHKLILIVPHSGATLYRGPIPLVATVPLDIRNDTLSLLLRAAIKREVTNARPAPSRASGRPTMGYIQHQSARRADPDNRSIRGQPPEAIAEHVKGTKRIEPEHHSRRDSDELEMAAMLRSLQLDLDHRRDQVTGLPDTTALSLVLRALPTVDHPTAVVVLDMWAIGTEPLKHNHLADTALLRSMGDGLRVTVRRDDLVCHLNQKIFAVVLPGVAHTNVVRPLTRLRAAMNSICEQNVERDRQLRLALGVGFWHPHAPAVNPFQAGWQAMIADRQAAAVQ